MIEQGDGKFSDRMTQGLCPTCQTQLKHIRDVQHKQEYYCTTCKLRIYDVKETKQKPIDKV